MDPRPDRPTAIPMPQPFVLLDDARSVRASPSRLYRNPVRCLSARTADELDALLDDVRAAGRAGLHAAGYLSYEAGFAFEPKLRAHLETLGLMPLAWFGLFERHDVMTADEVPALRESSSMPA